MARISFNVYIRMSVKCVLIKEKNNPLSLRDMTKYHNLSNNFLIF